jgi:hypothetical protein
MRTVAVVVIDVGVQDALELARAGDQDPVEALASHGPDEAIGKRVGPRSLDEDVRRKPPVEPPGRAPETTRAPHIGRPSLSQYLIET